MKSVSFYLEWLHRYGDTNLSNFLRPPCIYIYENLSERNVTTPSPYTSHSVYRQPMHQRLQTNVLHTESRNRGTSSNGYSIPLNHRTHNQHDTLGPHEARRLRDSVSDVSVTSRSLSRCAPAGRKQWRNRAIIDGKEAAHCRLVQAGRTLG